jgi:hypothetical protein
VPQPRTPASHLSSNLTLFLEQTRLVYREEGERTKTLTERGAAIIAAGVVALSVVVTLSHEVQEHTAAIVALLATVVALFLTVALAVPSLLRGESSDISSELLHDFLTSGKLQADPRENEGELLAALIKIVGTRRVGNQRKQDWLRRSQAMLAAGLFLGLITAVAVATHASTPTNVRLVDSRTRRHQTLSQVPVIGAVALANARLSVTNVVKVPSEDPIDRTTRRCRIKMIPGHWRGSRDWSSPDCERLGHRH